MSKSNGYSARLKNLYINDLRKKLQKDLKLSNINQVPKFEKVIVSVGLGRSKDDKRLFEVASNTLRKITGQNPVITKARKSIAGFKLREGQNVGMKVTLRDERMYEFLDRLVNVVLPRLRDFHGVSVKSFDGQGNYSLGFKEQTVFPELSFEDTVILHGVEITIVTTSSEDDKARTLIESIGMPYAKGGN